MSAEPRRKRKHSVTSEVPQSSRGPQKETSCVPVKNRKLGTVSKVGTTPLEFSCIFCTTENTLELFKTCFLYWFQPYAIEKFTADKAAKRLVIWRLQIGRKHYYCIKILFDSMIFFFNLCSLKRVHSETDLDTETQRTKIFLSEPTVSSLRVKKFWFVLRCRRSNKRTKSDKRLFQKGSFFSFFPQKVVYRIRYYEKYSPLSLLL